MTTEPSHFSPDPASVRRALSRLPFLDCQVLLLKSRDHLTYEQIGAILGLAPEAAEARYAVALVKMRALLEPHARFRRRWWLRVWPGAQAE